MTPRLVPLINEPIQAELLEEALREGEERTVVTFQSVLRRESGKDSPVALDIEVYEAMAAHEISKICDEVKTRWPGAEAVMQHRVGRVKVGETTAFMAVFAPSREEAFNACHFAVERLRTQVPLWKKEIHADGSSTWSSRSHETMMLSDQDNLSIPAS